MAQSSCQPNRTQLSIVSYQPKNESSRLPLRELLIDIAERQRQRGGRTTPAEFSQLPEQEQGGRGDIAGKAIHP